VTATRGELPDDGPEAKYSTDAVLDQIAAWLGIALHAELAYLPFLLSFFIAPIVVTIAIYVGWFALLRRIVKHRDEHPRLILALPIVEAIAWLGLMTLGVQYLGWAPLQIFPNR
jgi:hypothetical protein